jgi:hypothetical protein
MLLTQSNNWEKSDIFINSTHTLHCTTGRLESNTSNASATHTVFCTSIQSQIIFCNGSTTVRLFNSCVAAVTLSLLHSISMNSIRLHPGASLDIWTPAHPACGLINVAYASPALHTCTNLLVLYYMFWGCKTFILNEVHYTEAWYHDHKTYMGHNTIFKLQKRIIRITVGLTGRDSCSKHFKKLKILPLQSQYILSLLLFVVGNRNYFKENSDIHNINTRTKSNLHKPLANLSTYQKGAYYYGIKVFNSLPTQVKDLSANRNRFRCALESFLYSHSFYTLDEYFNCNRY